MVVVGAAIVVGVAACVGGVVEVVVVTATVVWRRDALDMDSGVVVFKSVVFSFCVSKCSSSILFLCVVRSNGDVCCDACLNVGDGVAVRNG